MAKDHIAIEKLRAGADYLAALQKLGLDPECLFWGFDEEMSEDVLFVVTALFDHVGPFEISKTLFKAYGLAATPREIDPFIVRLHSPLHTAIGQIAQFVNREWVGKTELSMTVSHPDGTPRSDVHAKMRGVNIDGIRISIQVAGVYKFNLATRTYKPVEASRRWARFQRNVDRMVA